MAIPFRLIAVALIVTTLLLAIVAAATTGWIRATFSDGDYHYIGLFKYCSSVDGEESCESTLDRLELLISYDLIPASCKSRFTAAQAFIVLAILASFPLLLLVFIRRFLSANGVGMAVAKITFLLDVVLALFIAFSLTVAWGAVANVHKECVCDFAEAAFGGTCGLNYSFALAIIAWLSIGGATVVVFLGKNENSGYSDMSAPSNV